MDREGRVSGVRAHDHGECFSITIALVLPSEASKKAEMTGLLRDPIAILSNVHAVSRGVSLYQMSQAQAARLSQFCHGPGLPCTSI